MTQFDITYTDFKREDTTNDITIKLYADNKRPIIPNPNHTWNAKVAKGDKYVGEYPVAIFGNVIKLSSSNLTRLPDGIYALELWETYDGSTAIYPSTGVMEFRVHENIDDTLGTIDPTTDINAIIEDLHKAGQNVKVVATNTLPAGSKASVTQSITNGENQLTFNIPQGDKGDKGEQGIQGPTGTNIIKYDGDIPGDGSPGVTATFDRSNLQPSDIAKVGDIVFDQFPIGNGINIGFWRITSLSSTSCTVAGLSTGFTIPKGEKGKDAVINVISQAEYDALADKSGLYVIQG